MLIDPAQTANREFVDLEGISTEITMDLNDINDIKIPLRSIK